jgi:hypothetical protein
LPFGADGWFGGLLFGGRFGGLVRRRGFHLAGGLVLREVELFFNLTLSAGQFLVTLLALELRSDPAFEFDRALLRIGDGGFKFAARSSNPCTVDSSERIVPRAVSVILAA